MVVLKAIVDVTHQHASIIKMKHSTNLFHSIPSYLGKLWNSPTTFDATMVNNHGAKNCELVALYAWLAAVKLCYTDWQVSINRLGTRPRIADEGRKDLCSAFKEFWLKTTAEERYKTVNFPGIILNLKNKSCQPYREWNTLRCIIWTSTNNPLPLSIIPQTAPCGNQLQDCVIVIRETILWVCL